MIPILFENDETDFTSNGLGRLYDCITCVVTEERNGIYECDFDYPITGAMYNDIRIGRIIGATHDDLDDIQPFDIVSYTKPIDGIVTFHAVHISYRQSYLTVKTSTGVNSLADAFAMIGNSNPANPFTYWTDKTSSGFLACADGTPRSVKQILGGIEGSILDTYSGEYEFDKWEVRLYAKRGTERDFSIRYGVNMVEYNEECDATECCNSCIPYWTDGENTVIGDKQTAIGNSPFGRDACVPLDLSEKFETQPSKAEVESMGLSVLNGQNPTVPVKSISVSFIRLQDLPEYKDFAPLLQCKLCDTINVVFADYNSVVPFKIVKTVWNVLADKYDSMELGTLSTTLSEALGIGESLGGTGTSSGDLGVTTLTVSGKATFGAMSESVFTETEETLIDNSSISAGSYYDGTLQLSKSGYYPLAVSGWYSTTRYFCNTRCYMYSRVGNTATLGYMIYNPSSSARTGTAKATILWLKTS